MKLEQAVSRAGAIEGARPALAAVEQEALEQLQYGMIFFCKTKSNELEEFVRRLQVFV